MGQSIRSDEHAVSWEIREGDALERLREMPDETVQCCVTSPPYFGLRDYGDSRQIGLEPNLLEYSVRLKDVFREVRRVLRTDGVLWLNLGDTFGKKKTLLGVPWIVARRLVQDGWILRSDVIWAKPDPMPESALDRPTNAHEHVFLLARSERYFYNADAIREPHTGNSADWRLAAGRMGGRGAEGNGPKHDARVAAGLHGRGSFPNGLNPLGRNRRDVWEIVSERYPDAHFATMPSRLAELCLLAGSREGDAVLDPFNGAGTTGVAALRNGRRYIGIELNGNYVAMARRRLSGVTSPLPGLAA